MDFRQSINQFVPGLLDAESMLVFLFSNRATSSLQDDLRRESVELCIYCKKPVLKNTTKDKHTQQSGNRFESDARFWHKRTRKTDRSLRWEAFHQVAEFWKNLLGEESPTREGRKSNIKTLERKERIHVDISWSSLKERVHYVIATIMTTINELLPKKILETTWRLNFDSWNKSVRVSQRFGLFLTASTCGEHRRVVGGKYMEKSWWSVCL